MVSTITPEAVEKGTGVAWSEWQNRLETVNAASLTHKEIARLLLTEFAADTWWAQMMTVLYEQQIGRREPGQDCEGQYTVSASKTITGSMDEAMQWWCELIKDKSAFADVPITREADVSATEKWRYWRAGLADGSRVNVNIYEKAPGKSSLSIQHERLESAEDVQEWRDYWKSLLSGNPNQG